MKTRHLTAAAFAGLLMSISAFAQATVVVNDPLAQAPAFELTAAEKTLIDNSVLPKVRAQLGTDACEEAVEMAGRAEGAFTRAEAKQKLIFYQYCQTGNGFGWNGLVLIEDGKVAASFLSDGGWGIGIGSVPDINQNGLTEFTLAYSGGMHQGQGGTGVELVEFAKGLPVGIGWYKADAYGPEETGAWKLTATPGKPPVFYKQKYLVPEGKKPRAVGRNAVTKLDKAFVSKFEVVK